MPRTEPVETARFASGMLLSAVIVDRLAERFKVLSDPTRLRLVNALHVEGELTVGQLVDHVGISYGAVSKQLSLLRAHGLLTRRQDGRSVYYRIGDPSLGELCDVACRGVREEWQHRSALLVSPAA